MTDKDGIPIDFSPDRDDPHADGAPPAAGGPGKSIRIEEALAALAMALICVISLANVVVRYLTDASFAFTEEFSVFLLVVMTLLGASIAFARNEHIRITFFLARLPRALRILAETLTFAITTFLFVLIVYYGATFAFDEYQYGEVSAGLGYPSWIYSVWLPLLALVILLRVWGHGLRVWRAARKARRIASSGQGGQG